MPSTELQVALEWSIGAKTLPCSTEMQLPPSETYLFGVSSPGTIGAAPEAAPHPVPRCSWFWVEPQQPSCDSSPHHIVTP